MGCERPAIKDPKPVDDTEAECPLDGGWKTGTPEVDDEDLHCDVDQRQDLSPEEWFSDYYLRGRPVLLRGALPLWERCVLTKEAAMRSDKVLNMGNNCGATAYPSITSQRFCPDKCTIGFLEDARYCEVPATHQKPAYQYRPVKRQISYQFARVASGGGPDHDGAFTDGCFC